MEWVKGWGPGPAKYFQNFQNMPSLWRHLQKTPTENEKRFFSMSTRRLAESVEALNSSLALAAGDLWPNKGRPIAVVKGLKGGRAKMLTSANNNINILSLYKHLKKTDILNWNVFFIANCIPSQVFRRFEKLSSSFWRRVIACSGTPPRVTFEGEKFWSIFGWWAIIFAPDMLESTSKAL